MTKHLRLLVIVLLQVFASQVYGQTKFPNNWFTLDYAKDSVFGISADKAYSDFLKGKDAKTVIVAVIDGGTDVSHEDLKDIIWTNPGEIPGNGIDDDHNGYVDDIHGWDFIGSKNGDVKEDTYELTRAYNRLNKKYADADPKTLSKADKAEYAQYLVVKKDYEEKKTEAATSLANYTSLKNSIEKIMAKAGRDSLSLVDLQGVTINSKWDSLAVVNLRKYMQAGMGSQVFMKNLDRGLDYFKGEINYHLNTAFNPRDIVGDNYSDFSQRIYGNNDVRGPKAEHGTHVAGIIGAERDNGIGINGIADHVQIMVVRVVPDGDERDKDVANAIRYAVDNGASVINMSFGKAYGYDKNAVDSAVRYAESKDVLLVHAAGNDSKNVDEADNFPNPRFAGTHERAANWVEVGASTPYENEKLTAPFSNYGKKNVDLFAPGYDIYSTVPDGKYQNNSGTSMASPVVAGVAALVRSYYPMLTADQVRNILMESVTPVKFKVYVPGTRKKTKMSKLCKSGGVVNAYQALELASKTQGKKGAVSAQR